MAKQTDTILKGYFETGDVPTQAQFEDLIDSKLNKKDVEFSALTANQASYTLNLNSELFISRTVSNNLTAVTLTFQNPLSGSRFEVVYSKTTASNCTVTLSPVAATLVNEAGPQTSLVLISATTTGVFKIVGVYNGTGWDVEYYQIKA